MIVNNENFKTKILKSKILFAISSKAIYQTFQPLLEDLRTSFNLEFLFLYSWKYEHYHNTILDDLIKGEKYTFQKDLIFGYHKIINANEFDILILGNDYGFIELSLIKFFEKESPKTNRVLIQDGYVFFTGHKHSKVLMYFMKKLFSRLEFLIEMQNIWFSGNYRFMLQYFLKTIARTQHTYGQWDVTDIFCMNKLSKLYFDKVNQKAKTVITGQPRFDKLHNEKTSKLKEVKRNTLLIILQDWIEEQYTTPNELRVSLKKIIENNFFHNIILRPHPGDRNSDRFYASISELIVVERKENVISLIKKSDFILVPYSTSVIEISILNKPFAIINLFGQFEYIPIRRFNAVEIFENVNSTVKFLESLDEIGENYLENFYTNIPKFLELVGSQPNSKRNIVRSLIGLTE